MKNPPFPAVPDLKQIKHLKNDKKSPPPSTLDLYEATPKLQRKFRVLIGQATHLGFLEVGGMYLNEEDKRKSRYVLTHRGIDALKGGQGKEDKRLLLDIAALYQELKDRRAEPEDKTNRNLPYGLAALREEMERSESYLKEHQLDQLEKKSGKTGSSEGRTEPKDRKEPHRKDLLLDEKPSQTDLQKEFDTVREGLARLPREWRIALLREEFKTLFPPSEPHGYRPYRNRETMPDRKKPADAEVNRPTQAIKFRLEPSILKKINEAARAAGTSRTKWLESTVEQYIALTK